MADASSRTCSRNVWPTRGTSPIMIAPRSRSAPAARAPGSRRRRTPGRFSSITRPDRRPFRASAWSAADNVAEHLLDLLQRRDAGQLEQRVAGRRGDDELGPDRPAALRHDAARTATPASTTPTAPARSTPPSRNRRSLAGAAAAREAAHQHRSAAEPVDQLVGGERVRVGDQHRQRVGRDVGDAAEVGEGVEHRRRRLGQRRREHRHGVAGLQLAAGADHAVRRDGARQRARRRLVEGERTGPRGVARSRRRNRTRTAASGRAPASGSSASATAPATARSMSGSVARPAP